MHETLVILMHSFNSFLWNLAPASLIIVRLKPHLSAAASKQCLVYTLAAWPCLWPVYTTPSSLIPRVSEGPFHFSQQSKYARGEFSIGFVFIRERECTAPWLLHADAILDFSRTGCRPAPVRLGSPCLAQEREVETQVGCCSCSSLQHGTACNNNNCLHYHTRHTDTFTFKDMHFNLKISSWAFRTSLRGRLDRQNSPSAKNLSLVITEIVKLLYSNKYVVVLITDFKSNISKKECKEYLQTKGQMNYKLTTWKLNFELNHL